MSVGNTSPDDYAMQKQAQELQPVAEDANALAEKLGLEPVDVTYWLVDYDEMNALISYDGFQTRYPHWRWGMAYERQKKKDQYGGGKAFEIVINDDPAHAFLQESNSMADQKAVITHVEAHADFFESNQTFNRFPRDDLNAAAMLENHARRINEYMKDPSIGRERVEKFIDSVLTLEDTIHQHQDFESSPDFYVEEEPDKELSLHDLKERYGISDEVVDALEDEEETVSRETVRKVLPLPGKPVNDVMAYLRDFGSQYDEDEGQAVEFDPWQRDVMDMLHKEAYYFAPQKMTQVMNEGWAAYWESIMMGDEAFAGDDEFMEYANHIAMVLSSPGFNPYSLGMELWEYVENTANREEVASKLLKVDGITSRNFHDEVDFTTVQDALQAEYPLNSISEDTLEDLAEMGDERIDQDAIQQALDGELAIGGQPWKLLTYDGLAERHFSLNKPQNRGFLERISREELERIDRYLEDSGYGSMAEALDDMDYTAGWDRMYEVRESHSDVTFIDEFLTDEFIQNGNYFTYEYSHATEDYRVASTDPEDVKKKILLQFTNFGKPTIRVADGNFNNRNELLLEHDYNGIQLNVPKAAATLQRAFDLWGRPVNLKTIMKEVDEDSKEVARRRGHEPQVKEVGKLIRYDGEEFDSENLSWEDVEDIAATDIDYNTKPDEWL